MLRLAVLMGSGTQKKEVEERGKEREVHALSAASTAGNRYLGPKVRK